MKVSETKRLDVDHNIESSDLIEFELKDENKIKLVTNFYDNLYEDKLFALVREWMANSWDAHVKAGLKSRPIEVVLPTEENPTFSVTNFGFGADRSLLEVMTSYGESTKGNSSEQTGGFGIGMKVVFGYQSAFTITTVLNKVEYCYVCAISPEHPIGVMRLLSSKPCNEEDKIQFSVSVKYEDIREFSEIYERIVRYWDVKPLSNFSGDIIPELVYTDDKCSIFMDLSATRSYPTIVRVGAICYELGATNVLQQTFSNKFKHSGFIYTFFNVVQKVSPDEFLVTQSRDHLKNVSRAKEVKIQAENSQLTVKFFQDMVKDCSSHWECAGKLIKFLDQERFCDYIDKNIGFYDYGYLSDPNPSHKSGYASEAFANGKPEDEAAAKRANTKLLWLHTTLGKPVFTYGDGKKFYISMHRDQNGLSRIWYCPVLMNDTTQALSEYRADDLRKHIKKNPDLPESIRELEIPYVGPWDSRFSRQELNDPEIGTKTFFVSDYEEILFPKPKGKKTKNTRVLSFIDVEMPTHDTLLSRNLKKEHVDITRDFWWVPKEELHVEFRDRYWIKSKFDFLKEISSVNNKRIHLLTNIQIERIGSKGTNVFELIREKPDSISKPFSDFLYLASFTRLSHVKMSDELQSLHPLLRKMGKNINAFFSRKKTLFNAPVDALCRTVFGYVTTYQSDNVLHPKFVKELEQLNTQFPLLLEFLKSKNSKFVEYAETYVREILEKQKKGET